MKTLRHRRFRRYGVAKALSIAELRAMALKLLPSVPAEYLEGGADDEISLALNRAGFDAIWFEPRLECDELPRPGAGGRFAHLAFPYVVAPTGLNGLYWPNADLMLAEAAAEAGVPFTQSTVSNCGLADIARVPGLDHWFQLYLFSDMDFVGALIQRAWGEGVRTLVVTVDANIFGNREWNARLYGADGRPNLAAKLHALCHPRWMAQVGRRKLPGFPNLSDWLGPDGRDLISASRWIRANMAPRVSWAQLEHVRALWPGTMLIKGIGHRDDARRAVAIGADGVVLGNHGGRQLDGAIPGIALLADCRADLGEGPIILVEGGVRRGSDILKARLMGADAVMGGRATLYGVAAGGRAGASRALAILRAEYERACGLLGSGTLRKT